MDQKPKKIFYGWWVVTACFIISLYIAGVVFFSFTAVFQPLVDEFGWTYAQISLAASLRGLETGLLAPLIGFLADRWGSRKLLITGIIITGLGLILLSRTASLATFYGAFVLIAIGVGTCSGTLFVTTIVDWFRNNVSLPAGITASGFAVGGILVPPVAILIDAIGWRTSMVYLALLMFVLCLPLAMIVKRNPERLPPPAGAVHDINGAAGEHRGHVPDGEREFTAGQALRSRMFWHIAIAFMLQNMALNAVVIHVMPYLGSTGVNRVVASLVASFVPIASILGRLGYGWIGDKYNKVRLLNTVFIFTTVGLILFGYTSLGAGTTLIIPFLICLGLGWGGGVTIRVGLLKECFGRRHFGTILGVTMGIMMVGNTVGPPLAGWVYDTWGTYNPIWFIFAGLTMISTIILATAPRHFNTPKSMVRAA